MWPVEERSRRAFISETEVSRDQWLQPLSPMGLPVAKYKRLCRMVKLGTVQNKIVSYADC